MKLPSLAHRADRDVERARKAVETVHESFVKAVWDAPADFNRAARRSVGMTGRIWRWNPPGGQPVPRYVRRHFTPTILANPTTRRQRRHRARILRAMKGQA